MNLILLYMEPIRGVWLVTNLGDRIGAKVMQSLTLIVTELLGVAVAFIKLSLEDTRDLSDSNVLKTINAGRKSSSFLCTRNAVNFVSVQSVASVSK